MSPILTASLVGFVAGPIGGGLAAVLGTTVLRGVRDTVRGTALAFAGGFILAMAFMELLRRGAGAPGPGACRSRSPGSRPVQRCARS